MFHKDTLRLISKTKNRFLSLMMIVLIGVAFMMGLMTCRPIMEHSVSVYAEKTHLQDYQLYSSYGFDDEDIKALKKQEFVQDVFGSKMVDAYCEKESSVTVARIEELDRNVNLFELIDGRLPQKNNEAVVLFGSLSDDLYKIGDELKVYLEDEDIHDHIKEDTFTIVGKAMSPAYMSKISGTSNLDNLELGLILYVPNDNFVFDYYTTVYMTLAEGRNYESFSDEYKEFIENINGDVEAFASRQQDHLKETILAETTAKIQEGEEELNKQKEEGQKKLDEAKDQLDEARIQIVAAQTQLSTIEGVLNQALSYQSTLTASYNRLASVNDKIKAIEKNDPQGRTFETIYAAVTRDYSTYSALKSMKDGGGNIFEDNIASLRKENSELQSRLDNELYPRQAELEAILSDENITEAEREAAQSELTQVITEINSIKNTISVNESLIANMEQMAASAYQDNIEEQMQQLDDQYNGSIEKTFTDYSNLMQDYMAYQAMRQEIDVANQAIAEARSRLAGLKSQIAQGEQEYQRGLKEYEDGVYKFNVEIEKAEAEIRKAYQQLEELPDAKWMILDRDSHYSSYLFANNASQMGAIGTILPILFYLVAALICMTTMTRLIDEQRGQIGVFRALGFSNGQIASKYVIYALLASLVGTIPGIFIGMAIFPIVVYTAWKLMYLLPDMIVIYPVKNILICLVGFSALMMAITYLVVRKTLKEMPSQLLRPKAPKNARTVFIEKITFIWKRLSFTSKVTARNLLRYKSRFFMTVIGVAGCTGLLVVGWGIRDSIREVVSNQFGRIMNYNYNISIENDKNVAMMVEELEKNLNNELVVPVMSYTSKVHLENKDDTINVEVIDARKGNDLYQLRLTDLKTPLKINNSGVIISQKFAKNHNLKKGDYISIESSTGLKASVKINDICEMYFQHYLFMSEDFYHATFEENVHYTRIGVKNEADSDIAESIKDIEGFVSVADFSSTVEQFNTMIKALDYIIMVIILSAGALAFVVLINLTQVNISERIREIATLKVLGFRTNEVNSYIFKEIFILSLIGAIAGLPLGVVEHHFVMTVIDMEMMTFGMKLQPLTFVYGFAITIGFTLIVMLVMRKNLAKVEMVESLKSVE